MLRRSLIAALLALSVVLGARVAGAHGLGRSFCTVETVPGGLDLTVETEAQHLGQVIGAPPGATPTDAELLAARDRIAERLRAQVTARTPSGPCTVRIDPGVLTSRDDQRALSMRMAFDCSPGPVTLHHAWRLDVDPSSEVVCSIDGHAWVFRLGLEERLVGTPPTLGQVLRSFVGLGAIHVFGGIDHVLFVVVLLVAAARESRDRTLARGLRGMAAVVTGFTAGHSVTLIAAGLDWVRLDSRVTESVIALSIVVVGLENVLRDRVHWRSLTAGLFGLVHGFGFASVLAQTELPRRGAVWALLSFNLGIELAQLAIVAVLFPLLAIAARKSWYDRSLLRPVSILVAALATVWFVKRAFALQLLPWLGS